jgi:hypothetical protein
MKVFNPRIMPTALPLTIAIFLVIAGENKILQLTFKNSIILTIGKWKIIFDTMRRN